MRITKDGISKDKARRLLREHGLRATSPRLAVLMLLSQAKTPLSHSQVVERLGETDWDPATIFRNLIKLRDVGIAPVVTRVGGVDRYALSGQDDVTNDHQHPHFVCDDCGQVACLPAQLTVSMADDGPWAESVAQAMVQLRGACPDCRTSA